VEWVRPVERERVLTEREHSVLSLLVRGCTYEEIGTALKISQKTVGSYIQRIREKTRVKTRQQLIEVAAAFGITP
jgi:DNA-binding CsgD family transcriptional regulator